MSIHPSNKFGGPLDKQFYGTEESASFDDDVEAELKVLMGKNA